MDSAVRLTKRETELLRCLVTGEPNKVIAFWLGITNHTVKAYLVNLRSKLKIESRVKLVLYAAQQGVQPWTVEGTRPTQ